VRRHRSRPIFAALPLALAIVAEAAWVSVLVGLVQEFTLHEPTLGIGALAALVAAGVVAARLLGPRLGDHWPTVALALCAAGGAVGWVSSPAVRDALASAAIGDALILNPGGWLAGLAVLRGFAHARLPLNEPTLAHMFAAGVPGLAIAAIAGGMVAEPFRSRFLADTIVAAITFATTATLALALTRLSAVGADAGFDWRRNPTWVGLLMVLVVAATTLAAVTSSIVAPAIAFVVGAAIGPLLVVAVVVGFNHGVIRILLIAVVVAIGFAALMSLVSGGSIAPGDLLGGGVPAATPAPPAEAVWVGTAALVAIAAVVIVLLARLWLRRVPRTEDDVDEIRTIDRIAPPARAARRRRSRGGPPVDAVGAYLALMGDLSDRPGVRRNPAETPAEHARRLRAADSAGLSLDLLAADYALVRFGGVTLSARENGRAVERWRSLRRRLGASGTRRGDRPQKSA
jgi:hypothetical protein